VKEDHIETETTGTTIGGVILRGKDEMTIIEEKGQIVAKMTINPAERLKRAGLAMPQVFLQCHRT